MESNIKTKVISVTVPHNFWDDERRCTVSFKGEVQTFVNPSQAVRFALDVADSLPKPVLLTIMYEGEL